VLPFASDVPLSSIIRLREREEDAFIRYRLALSNAVQEVTKQGQSLSERQARQIHSDIIRPRLAELNQRVSQSKRDLVNEPATTAIATAAVVSFGFFTGLLTPELNAFFGAAGLSKLTYDAVKSALAKSDVQRTIRDNEMYFLWRLARQSRNSP
jgi:hypothetical protein